MKIDVWSDYVCPFCYIGKRRLEMALELFPHKDEVEVIYRSYQLSPDAKREPEADIHTLLAAKYGTTRDQAKAMNEQIGEQAKAVGLTYRFDTMKHTNTFDAHRLSHFASDQGKAKEMTENLLKAYFTESLHIGDHHTLAMIAEQSGLNKTEVMEVLSSDRYSDQVKEDLQTGAKLGIEGVPFFVFNNKYAVSGAQAPETFSEVLQKVWEEEQATSPIQIINNVSKNRDSKDCSDGSCSL